ncbi:MAG: hypothetical protein HQM16_02725 [Deltaproteobacteria bacterium]|nr:hypothetical protein [Deltaproteobacteria bacterium]
MQKKKRIVILCLCLAVLLTAVILQKKISPQTQHISVNKEQDKTRPIHSQRETNKNVLYRVEKPAKPSDAEALLIKEMAEVKKQVEEINKIEGLKEEALLNDGWQPSESEPPDEKVLNLDPSLLGEREDRLQSMMQSTSLKEKNIDNVYQIARQTKDEKTRHLAIEALGNSPFEKSAAKLVELFHDVDNKESQDQILSVIKPRKLNDTGFNFMISVLNDQNTDNTMKKQAASALLAFGLINGYDESDFDSKILSGVDENTHHYITEMYDLIK